MKTAGLLARIPLGLIFVVFGLNGFMLPLLFASQVLGGTLLLLGMVPLGAVILAAVIVNIVAFHVFLAPGGLPLAVVVASLALFLAWTHREAYRPLFAPQPQPSRAS